MTGRHISLAALALLSACSFAGCTKRIAYLPAISTKPLDAATVNLELLSSKEVDSGSAYRFLGLGAKVDKAVDNVLTENDANLLVDAVVYCDYFWPFYGYRVTGRAYSIPSQPAQ